MAGCRDGRIPVVPGHGVDIEFGDGPVEQNQWHAGATDVLEMIDAVAASGRDDQAIDTFADQEVDGRFFRIELFARIGDDDVEARKAGRIADAAHRQTEESVFDIADHDPDDAGPSGAHAPGELVRAVFEGGRRRHDLIRDLGADHAVAAKHTGGRRLRDLCGLRDVGDRD